MISSVLASGWSWIANPEVKRTVLSAKPGAETRNWQAAKHLTSILPVESERPRSAPEGSVAVAPGKAAPLPSVMVTVTVTAAFSAVDAGACALSRAGSSAAAARASVPAIALDRNHCICFASQSMLEVVQ